MNGRCRFGLLEQRIETTSKVVSILIGWAISLFIYHKDIILGNLAAAIGLCVILGREGNYGADEF
jgi:hypothetical protein